MADAGGAAPERDLAELEQDRGGGRVDVRADSGIEMTGRSLSGMRRRWGTPGRSSSASGTWWISATSVGIRVQRAGRSVHTTTGVITKPERVA